MTLLKIMDIIAIIIFFLGVGLITSAAVDCDAILVHICRLVRVKRRGVCHMSEFKEESTQDQIEALLAMIRCLEHENAKLKQQLENLGISADI